MKSLPIAVLIFASGCASSSSELRRVLADSKRLLEADQNRIRVLKEKPTLSFFELTSEIDEAIAATPELRKEIDALPLEQPAVLGALPALPIEGANESAEDVSLRREVAATQAEARKTREVLENIEGIEAQRRRLAAALELIKSKRAGRAP